MKNHRSRSHAGRAARASGPLGVLAMVALPLALAACSEDGPTPPPALTSRNNAVIAASGKPSAAPTGSAAAPPKSAPRDLCGGQRERPGPKGPLKNKAAPNTDALPATVAFGAGKWIWLNFWAAWCGPCKEEMPRLIAWQEKLRKAGVLMDLVFVSLDDDERQLERFIEGQPASGVRASYWLPEGGGRTTFLSSLHVKDTPELPLQAFVSPAGQLACTVQGAVEDRDYEPIAAFLGAKK